MKVFLFSIIFALSLFACKNDEKNANEFAYLGGEIINPTNNSVILLHSEVVLDTIKLDNHNRFLHKIENLIPGFYTFKHGSEIQMVLLEPLDSIIFRLNTLDFDESLVYSGEGSKKNNYLINDFLQNEIVEKKVFKLCQLNPIDFEKEINLIRENKTKQLNKFIKKNETSELFDEIAKANINYNYYSNKEIYPIINFGYNKHSIFKELPKDFYSYRQDVDYNNEGYADYLNYNSFLRSNFNNLALEEHINHSKENHFKSTSVCYNLDRLNLIDSLVTNHSIKNDLLYYFTMSFLSKNKEVNKNDAITKLFLSKSTNTKNNKIITNLNESINNLKPGKLFPNIELLTAENSELYFNSIISKPTAIYFWSHNFYEHFKESHYKVLELKNKYPEVEFIAVNIDDFNLEGWTDTLKRNSFSFVNEYQFKNPEESMHTLAIYPMTKVIIVDKDNIIVNSNANLFSSNFEEQLLGLINQ